MNQPTLHHLLPDSNVALEAERSPVRKLSVDGDRDGLVNLRAGDQADGVHFCKLKILVNIGASLRKCATGTGHRQCVWIYLAYSGESDDDDSSDDDESDDDDSGDDDSADEDNSGPTGDNNSDDDDD